MSLLSTANRDSRWVRRWYSAQVQRFGCGLAGMGYRHRSSQRRRFEALYELAPFQGRSVLDAGCGAGDFLAYLRERRCADDYTGIDICPELVAHCRARFGLALGPRVRFDAADILSWRPERPYDLVVSSGVFGLRSRLSTEGAARTLSRLFSWCRVGLAVNFLCGKAAGRPRHLALSDPGRMLALALRLTPAVRLFHDYLPNDFTLHLYRVPAWAQDGWREARHAA